MKKLFIIILLLIPALFIGLIIGGFQYLNEDEYYYGVISSDNKTAYNLVAKDNTMKVYDLTSNQKYQHGDIIRVHTTDGKGVIVDTKKFLKIKYQKKY
ncbi:MULTISPECIES: hypothetical protein [Staphylococcus]|uniref:Uncharacterized protein n=1 Tax=Staphylococcus hsinchuensis TaxID=3051183 RepID=A0ABZ3ECA1_9STAP